MSETSTVENRDKTHKLYFFYRCAISDSKRYIYLVGPDFDTVKKYVLANAPRSEHKIDLESLEQINEQAIPAPIRKYIDSAVADMEKARDRNEDNATKKIDVA